MGHSKNESAGIRKTKTIGPSLKATLRRPWYIWSKNPPLSVTYPEIARQWHKTKNGPWTPNDFTARSNSKVWWRCKEGPDHVFQTRIASRTLAVGNGCPFCRGLKASVTNSLASLYPKVAEEWHPTKNGKLTAKDVVAKSSKRRWWRCRKGHAWQAQVNNRTTSHSGCPYCSGRNVTPERALSKNCRDAYKYWHPTKNGELKPSDVSIHSTKVIWWRCPKDEEHEWQAAVGTFTRALNSFSRGCPYCRGLRASTGNSLASRFPEIAKELHPSKNGPLKAEDLSYGSFKQVWWQCRVNSRHVFRNHVSMRTGRGHGCPYCSGRRVSNLNSLASRFPKIAKLWHKTRNKQLTPSTVSYSSAKKIWWQCCVDVNHVWLREVQSMTGQSARCPHCPKTLNRKR